MSKKSGDSFIRLLAYHNEVTGSRFVLYIKRPDEEPIYIGVDRGYIQEKKYQELNYLNEFDDSKLDALIITHNHADHQGMVPFAVKCGYYGNIYMTSITANLIYPFWIDAASHQGENAKVLKKKYNSKKIPVLFGMEDVEKAMELVKPVEYLETQEILPGIKLTFLDNGHLLGSAMCLLQISSYGRKDINILFTGDYKPTSEWKNVLPIPKWVKDLDLTVVCESTYGTTLKSDIKKCFEENILKAIEEKKRILIPVLAQHKEQYVLYLLKCLQEAGKIPPEYIIYVDGSLGITTDMRYASILKKINPKMKDFMPNDLIMVDINTRPAVAMGTRPAIIVSTSGMMSNGPAKTYAEYMLSNPNALIHLCSYVAEGTLARKIFETKYGEMVEINGNDVEKRCDVKNTPEISTHAKGDELLDLLNELDVQILFINHGSFEAKNGFEAYVKKNGKIKEENIFQIDRSQVFTIYQLGNNEYSNLKVSHFTSKLIQDDEIELAFIQKYSESSNVKNAYKGKKSGGKKAYYKNNRNKRKQKKRKY